jgi:S-adenosylmethionine:tRNA ribosyltransferase-isomerase
VGPEAFDYELPHDRIAQHPAPVRGDARMMVMLRGGVVHTHARALVEHLPPGALVVVNASSVVPARMDAQRADGRSFELLWCAPAAGQGPGATVRAWVRGGKRLRRGDVIVCGALELRCDDDGGDGRERSFVVVAGDVLDACKHGGRVPLPPYIARPTGPDADDRARYQTVYADREGSIAAPTAGLHFDDAALARLDVVRLHLHVGPGTFSPMDVADVRDHRVGAERIEIDEDAATRIEAARAEGRPIVAVGTTVVRALETLAKGGAIAPTRSATELVIVPGHRFAVVTHLLTNFHLPRSSLLMLVCAFAGTERVLAAYRDAVAQGYRFYSYGDCMLTDGAP